MNVESYSDVHAPTFSLLMPYYNRNPTYCSIVATNKSGYEKFLSLIGFAQIAWAKPLKISEPRNANGKYHIDVER